MVEHHITSFGNMLIYRLLDLLLTNLIRSVKIFQIKMPCIPLANALGLHDKFPAGSIHQIECCLTVIKIIRQRLVKRIIDILDIERSDLVILPDNRTFHGIRPSPHIIDIRTGKRQAIHRLSRRKIQPFLREHLFRV